MSFSVFLLPVILLLSIRRKRSFTPIYFNFWLITESVCKLRASQPRCSGHASREADGSPARAGSSELRELLRRGSPWQRAAVGPTALQNPGTRLQLLQHFLGAFYLFPDYMSLLRLRFYDFLLLTRYQEPNSSWVLWWEWVGGTSRQNSARVSQRFVTKGSCGMEEHVEAISEDLYIHIYLYGALNAIREIQLKVLH